MWKIVLFMLICAVGWNACSDSKGGKGEGNEINVSGVWVFDHAEVKEVDVSPAEFDVAIRAHIPKMKDEQGKYTFGQDGNGVYSFKGGSQSGTYTAKKNIIHFVSGIDSYDFVLSDTGDSFSREVKVTYEFIGASILEELGLDLDPQSVEVRKVMAFFIYKRQDPQ